VQAHCFEQLKLRSTTQAIDFGEAPAKPQAMSLKPGPPPSESVGAQTIGWQRPAWQASTVQIRVKNRDFPMGNALALVTSARLGEGTAMRPRRRPHGQTALRPLSDRPDFRALVQDAFGLRRKQMRRVVRTVAHLGVDAADQVLAAASIDPECRPETLSPGDFARLLHAISGRGS